MLRSCSKTSTKWCHFIWHVVWFKNYIDWCHAYDRCPRFIFKFVRNERKLYHQEVRNCL